MTYLNEFKILHEYEYVSVKKVRALKMKYEDLIVVVLKSFGEDILYFTKKLLNYIQMLKLYWKIDLELCILNHLSYYQVVMIS